MGQEIQSNHFKRRDFQRFSERLRDETELLRDWFAHGGFSAQRAVGGLELEAWLVDAQYRPAPINDVYLKQLNDPWVVPELAKFNVEFNVKQGHIAGHGLRRIHNDLEEVWQRADKVAGQFDAAVMMTGILQSARDEDLTLDNMSSLKRYQALNEQVLKRRLGQPLHLDIRGHEHLQTVHRDVMLESAATSLQLHLQVPAAVAKRYYNAAVIVSAPMVAMSANSPFLFGKDLWDETRIPLFEQAVEVGGYGGAARGPVRRVTFGSGYVRHSLEECFIENLEHYPVLLPMVSDYPRERMAHVCLHNGTIWRWNRPLIGFDDNGIPHVRIEHRVCPAGPTVKDIMANAAFFFGLTEWLATQATVPELQLPFSVARDNFYHAARSGLEAHIQWLEGDKHPIAGVILDDLLPMARRGLEQLGLDGDDIDDYLNVIATRVRHNCNGAAWQRAYVSKHGRDMCRLAQAYLERQRSGIPVHQWDI